MVFQAYNDKTPLSVKLLCSPASSQQTTKSGFCLTASLWSRITLQISKLVSSSSHVSLPVIAVITFPSTINLLISWLQLLMIFTHKIVTAIRMRLLSKTKMGWAASPSPILQSSELLGVFDFFFQVGWDVHLYLCFGMPITLPSCTDQVRPSFPDAQCSTQIRGSVKRRTVALV